MPLIPTPLTRTAVAIVCLMAQGLAWADAAWFDDQNQPKSIALQALKVLANADAEGLKPADYAADSLQKSIAADSAQPLTAEQAAALDTQLTQHVERYLDDLRNGRIDPHQIRENYHGGSADAKPFSAADTLRSALASGDLKEALAAATPPTPMYADLRTALARHRDAAASGLWNLPANTPSSAPAKRQGAAGSGPSLPVAVQRLIALGDMELPAQGQGSAAYNKALQAGVRSFQQRHGLAETGAFNKATLEQLNVAPSLRADQIALAMERQRWTPYLQGSRIIVVNVPEFALHGYDIQNGQMAEKLRMRVIVGKARDTRTPLFDRDMRLIEFSPYWNVPPSIANKELIPKIQRDGGYLARNNYEIVGTGGVQGVLNGTARIRQKPGPHNALGDIKFVFPNSENIYLHHTSSPGLFGRDRRDFSHGCVRVQEPVDLAKFVLQDDPQWTEDRIRKAMDRGQSNTVRLKNPVPVLITYSTTIVRDGKVAYLPDVYGQDALLAKALRERKAGKTLTNPAPALQKIADEEPRP